MKILIVMMKIKRVNVLMKILIVMMKIKYFNAEKNHIVFWDENNLSRCDYFMKDKKG